MRWKWIILSSFCMSMLLSYCPAFLSQSLAEIARQENEKKGQKKKASRTITNEDLNSAPNETTSSNSDPSQKSSVPSAPSASAPPNQLQNKEDPERAWSKKFLDAKGKLKGAQEKGAELQKNLNEMNLRLMQQSDIYDREHLLNPMIAEAQKQSAQNKLDIQAAEQELENLREELRRSGDPVSWENSVKALEPEAGKNTPTTPAQKDRQYWQDQLKEIDKKYDDLVHQLEIERFRLLNRRPPSENEPLNTPTNLGMGAPPRINEIDNQLKELRKKQEQERTSLQEKALSEGALPGWFR